MAHFAKIEDGVVTQVTVVNNDILLDENGDEQESLGVEFLNNLFGNANWKQTSYNGNFRNTFAGEGFVYNETDDVFYEPQPHASWTLDENYKWQPPVASPTDGIYDWNEENYQADNTQGWVKIGELPTGP